MEKLKLDFLGEGDSLKKPDPIQDILGEFGEVIRESADGYFYYIVTTSFHFDVVEEASLYIIVPEIGYDYKVITIGYRDIKNIVVHFYTLKTSQTQTAEISIENGWEGVRDKVWQFLRSPLANSTFKFLIDQVNMKRESREEDDE